MDNISDMSKKVLERKKRNEYSFKEAVELIMFLENINREQARELVLKAK